MIKTIARFLNVPYVIEDCTSFSASGFVGRDVDQIIQDLVMAANGKDITEKVQRAEMGIVYLDEFDKLTRKGESPSISKDVGGEAVQQALLKLIEGGDIDVSVTRGQRITPTTQTVKVNTENILFICGGSFEGIERIILKRLHEGKSSMGFGAPLKATDKNKTDVLLSVTQEDIKQFGIIPEILGRLPILCPLRDLTVPDLVDILTKPKNALVTQYKELFKMDGSTLEITEEALQKIATLALQKGTGARALRTVLEETLAPVMFDLPENPTAVKVTLAAVSDNPEEDKLTIIKEPLEGACGAP